MMDFQYILQALMGNKPDPWNTTVNPASRVGQFASPPMSNYSDPKQFTERLNPLDPSRYSQDDIMKAKTRELYERNLRQRYMLNKLSLPPLGR